MKRVQIQPRQDWEKEVEKYGLTFHHTEGRPYWTEDAYYQFSAKEVDELEIATNELSRLCLDAVQHVIDSDRFEELKIPAFMVPLIKQSWETDAPSIYGRFDLAYDGGGLPKLLEYNADTPTSLLEAAVIQWYWLKDRFPDSDQFNSIHERLVAKWKDIKPYLKGDTLHFTHVHDDANPEDSLTITYLRDTAQQAGIKTDDVVIDDVGFNYQQRRFVDMQGKAMTDVFKLYPWEWMVNEEFGKFLVETYQKMSWIEPPWKMILSNKGVLPILWERNKDHPNLLETYADGPRSMQRYVKKPLFSREGANVEITLANESVKRDGAYGKEGHIYQAYAELPVFDGKRPVIGSWLIDHEAAGIGIREASGLITDNQSGYVPHKFD